MTRIVLVRHGHVEGIDPERFRGRLELPLSALGKLQAQATARRIAKSWPFAAIYSSPLGRCLETAAAIGASTSHHVVSLDGLTDIDYGAWQWKSFAEVRIQAPDEFNRWLETPELVRFPGGESLEDLQARTSDALRAVCEQHPHQTAIMVGHDSVNRVILLQLLGMPLSSYWRLTQSPCGINEIDFADGQIKVRRVNESGHLEGLTP